MTDFQDKNRSTAYNYGRKLAESNQDPFCNSHISGRYGGRNVSNYVEPVAKGHEIKPQLSLKDEARKSIINGTADEIWRDIVLKVLTPNAVDMADRLITGIKDVILWRGKEAVRNAAKPGQSYNYSASRPASVTLSEQDRIRHDLRNIAVDSPEEAKLVLDLMFEALSSSPRGFVSSAYFYKLTGIKTEWADEDWGWYDLVGADAYKRPDKRWGFILPKLVPLRRDY